MNISKEQREKYYKIRKLNKMGVPITKCCQQVGIGRQTYYTYHDKISCEKKLKEKYTGEKDELSESVELKTSSKKSNTLFTSKSSKTSSRDKKPIKSITKSQMSTNPDDYEIDLIDKKAPKISKKPKSGNRLADILEKCKKELNEKI